MHPHNGEGLQDGCGATSGDDKGMSPLPSACEPSLDYGCLQDECGITSGDDARASLLSSAAKPTASAGLIKTVHHANLSQESHPRELSLTKYIPYGCEPLQSDADEITASFTSLGPIPESMSESSNATTMSHPLMQHRHCLGARQWGRVLLHNLKAK